MIDSQKERILITDPKKIRLLKKDFTKKILSSFSDKPKTASDIARTISFPKEKIYYHIKNLLNHDILFIANTDIIKGIEQKQFLPTAKEFKIETENPNFPTALEVIYFKPFPFFIILCLLT